MVIYVSVQEIKHDTNKTRDNTTDTFRSDVILVVNQVGITHAGMRGRQTISMYILKEKPGVKNRCAKYSDLKPFPICSLHYISYMVAHEKENHLAPIL